MKLRKLHVTLSSLRVGLGLHVSLCQPVMDHHDTLPSLVDRHP